MKRQSLSSWQTNDIDVVADDLSIAHVRHDAGYIFDEHRIEARINRRRNGVKFPTLRWFSTDAFWRLLFRCDLLAPSQLRNVREHRFARIEIPCLSFSVAASIFGMNEHQRCLFRVWLRWGTKIFQSNFFPLPSFLSRRVTARKTNRQTLIVLARPEIRFRAPSVSTTSNHTLPLLIDPFTIWRSIEVDFKRRLRRCKYFLVDSYHNDRNLPRGLVWLLTKLKINELNFFDIQIGICRDVIFWITTKTIVRG